MFVQISVFPLWSLPSWAPQLHSRISLRNIYKDINIYIGSFWQEKTCQYRFCKSNNPSLLPLLVSKFTLRFDQVYQTSYMSHPLLQQQQQLLLWQQHDTCSWTRSCQTHNFRHPHWTLRGFRLPNLFYKFKTILPHDFIRNLEESNFRTSSQARSFKTTSHPFSCADCRTKKYPQMLHLYLQSTS